MRRAAEVLNAGKKVAVLAGPGARGATGQLVEAAEALGAGVAKALLGKDVLADDLGFVTGPIGLLGTRPSYEMMRDCATLADRRLEAPRVPAFLAGVTAPNPGRASATSSPTTRELVCRTLFRTRVTPVPAAAGLLATAAAAALLMSFLRGHGSLVSVGIGLTGLGVGASVSPALFTAGFSMRSRQLQRVFALIELLRGVTASLVAPVLAFLVGALARTPAAGTATALWICLGIAAAGFLGGTACYLAGKGALEAPDLERWRATDEPAWRSPPVLSRLRRPLLGASQGTGDAP